MAPKNEREESYAVEHRTTDRVAHAGESKQAGSMSGHSMRDDLSASAMSVVALVANATSVDGDVQPHERTCTSASVSDPIPTSSSAELHGSGNRRSATRRSSNVRNPTTHARMPNGTSGPERPAPPTEIDEPRTKRRARRGRHRSDGAPDRHRECPASRGHGIEQQRDRGGPEHRRADCLHDARGDEHGHVRRQCTGSRSDHERREPDERDTAMPDPVGDDARRNQHRGSHDRVDAQHPRQRRAAGVGPMTAAGRETPRS